MKGRGENSVLTCGEVPVVRPACRRRGGRWASAEGAYDTVIQRFVAFLGPRIGKTQDGPEAGFCVSTRGRALQHPNLVTLFDFGDAGLLYLAMELVEGRDLSAIIAANEPLGLERKLDIVIELLGGLAYPRARRDPPHQALQRSRGARRA